MTLDIIFNSLLCAIFSTTLIFFPYICRYTNFLFVFFFSLQPNESGFVLLGDLSLETSTDSDYDDFSMCPPSPCDVEFENANIVIDGKSSIRQKSKEATVSTTLIYSYAVHLSCVVEKINCTSFIIIIIK